MYATDYGGEKRNTPYAPRDCDINSGKSKDSIHASVFDKPEHDIIK